MSKLDRGKIEQVLHNNGLSRKRVEKLGKVLANSDLMEDELIIKRNTKQKDVTEVLVKK